MQYDTHSVEGRFLAGDSDAIGEVFQWIARVLTRPRFWRLRDDLPDLHQEVAYRVTASLRTGRYDRDQAFRAYVIGIAHFTAIKRLERDRVRAQHSAYVEDAQVAWSRESKDVSEHVEARQLARLLLEEASESCRDLIVAYFFDDRSYDEIAQSEGVPVGTIKSRLFRCLEKLKKAVRDRNEPSTAGNHIEERPGP